jgi:hypothetical protein
MKKTLGVALPALALVLIAGAAVLAVPHPAAPTAPGASLLASGSPMVYPTSTPTKAAQAPKVVHQAQTQPTPTDTPVPPTPTATVAPSWHAVGSYSGSTEGVFATLNNVAGPFRIDWTCQAGTQTWQVGFEMVDAANAGHTSGAGTACSPTNLSGTLTFDDSDVDTVRTWNVTASCGGTNCAMGNWTATVYEWS